MNNNIDAAIFGDYDIRGTYPDQINEHVYHVIGQAIAVYLKVPTIAVGYDMRLSSPMLFKGLTSGITKQGVNVINLGLISTEMHYFASGKFQYPANIIISASHNPANYNGLKIVTKGVIPLHGNFGLPEIKNLALKNIFPAVKLRGRISKKDITKEWILHALSFINPSKLKPLKVVIDAGNGMGGVSWKLVSPKLPINLVPMFFTPDGNFPHHLPDPLKEENIVQLKNEVIKQNADIGFAIDGDADRLFVVDEKGNQVSGTITTALLSQALLEKYGPNPVLYNVVCGKIVPETIKRLKGKPIRTRVGHSFIKELMKKNKALFAGEHSGHFYFRDNYYAESSLIAGLYLLEYLSLQNKTFSKLILPLQKYHSSQEINFHLDDRESIIKIITQKYKDASSIDSLDGLSVMYDNWWFNLRSSKTEPLLRLNIEANSKKLLMQKIEEISSLIIGQNGVKI